RRLQRGVEPRASARRRRAIARRPDGLAISRKASDVRRGRTSVHTAGSAATADLALRSFLWLRALGRVVLDRRRPARRSAVVGNSEANAATRPRDLGTLFAEDHVLTVGGPIRDCNLSLR